MLEINGVVLHSKTKDKTGYLQFAGFGRQWFADHDPTSNEVTAGPEYGTIEFSDHFINLSSMRVWWCTDATPGNQKWLEIAMIPYVAPTK